MLFVLNLIKLDFSFDNWNGFSLTVHHQSPFLNKDGENCGFCGKTPEEMKDCNEDKSNS